MFDLSFPVQPIALPAAFASVFASADPDPSPPFALTLPVHNPAAAMSGEARSVVLDRFATLADAMRGAIFHAEQIDPDAAPQVIAILDRDDRHGRSRHAWHQSVWRNGRAPRRVPRRT